MVIGSGPPDSPSKHIHPLFLPVFTVFDIRWLSHHRNISYSCQTDTNLNSNFNLNSIQHMLNKIFPVPLSVHLLYQQYTSFI